MIKVCSVMRATSKRLCFIASMALSNKTLSGCFEPTLARGLTLFLFVQATLSASNRATAAINENRRDIRPQMKFQLPTANCWRYLDFQQRSFSRRLQQRLSILSWIVLTWITTTEHGVARHQDFSARAHHIAYRVVPHAAIHFNAVSQPPLTANLRQLPHFVQRRRNKLLPPKPRIHRHHQHVLDNIEYFRQ